MMSNLFKKLMLYTLILSCGGTGLLQAAEDNGSRFGTLFRRASHYANNAIKSAQFSRLGNSAKDNKNEIAAGLITGSLILGVTGKFATLWLDARSNLYKVSRDLARAQQALEITSPQLEAYEQEREQMDAQHRGAMSEKEKELKEARDAAANAVREKDAQLQEDYVRYIAGLEDNAQMYQQAAETYKKNIVAMEATHQQDLKKIDGRRKTAVQRNWRLAGRLVIAQGRLVIAKQRRFVTARNLVEEMYKNIDALNLAKTAERETFLAEYHAVVLEHNDALAEQAARHEQDVRARVEEAARQERARTTREQLTTQRTSRTDAQIRQDNARLSGQVRDLANKQWYFD